MKDMGATTMDKSRETLSESLRKGLSTPVNRRALSRVSGLGIESCLPERFQSLLGELDRAEKASSPRR